MVARTLGCANQHLRIDLLGVVGNLHGIPELLAYHSIVHELRLADQRVCLDRGVDHVVCVCEEEVEGFGYGSHGKDRRGWRSGYGGLGMNGGLCSLIGLDYGLVKPKLDRSMAVGVLSNESVYKRRQASPRTQDCKPGASIAITMSDIEPEGE